MTRRAYVWIFDIAGAQSGVIGKDFREIYTDVTLDQTEVLRFTIPAAHSKAYLLAEDLTLRYNGRLYFVDELTQRRSGTETLIEVVAPALWYRLGELDHVGLLTVNDDGVRVGAVEILHDSGWAPGPQTPTTGTFSMETQDRSVLANIRTWAKITGTFVEFDTLAKTVDWLPTRGRDVGLAFRKGRNLRNVERRRKPPRVTEVVPFGRDDLSIAGVSGSESIEDLSFYTAQGLTADAARDAYGKRKVRRDASFVDENDLLAWAQGLIGLESQSLQSVELDVIDISEITGVNEDLEPGDRARAFDPDFDEEFSATVTRFQRHPLQPARNIVELSTSPQIVGDPDSSNARPLVSDEWIQFVGPISADFIIRNDATWTVARIPLRFRDDGLFHLGLDLTMVGVGAGDVTVQLWEAVAGAEIKSWSASYTDAQPVRIQASFAVENLPSGSRDYRLRVSTVANGGPSATNGVDLTFEDRDGIGPISWWVMTQRAVRETPPGAPNTETFEQLESLQWFTVPDNVTEISIIAAGAVGTGTRAGNGCRVSASGFAVVPGETLAVLAGANGGPLGGLASAGPGNSANSGGGVSMVCRGVATLAGMASVIDSDILIAAGGGGGSGRGGENGDGGHGGFFNGADGSQGSGGTAGAGGTQFAGGAKGSGIGVSVDASSDGARFYGGEYSTGSSTADCGGAGGVGYYGGGAGGGASAELEGAGGGGGSGFVSPSALDLIVQDGANSGPGQVVISWEDPVV